VPVLRHQCRYCATSAGNCATSAGTAPPVPVLRQLITTSINPCMHHVFPAYLQGCITCMGPWHKVLTYVEYRAVSGVFQNIDPPPPFHPTHLPGGEEWGVNILEDARHGIGLLQYNLSGLYGPWYTVYHASVYNTVCLPPYKTRRASNQHNFVLGIHAVISLHLIK
jgi:hypothetical protein